MQKGHVGRNTEGVWGIGLTLEDDAGEGELADRLDVCRFSLKHDATNGCAQPRNTGSLRVAEANVGGWTDTQVWLRNQSDRLTEDGIPVPVAALDKARYP